MNEKELTRLMMEELDRRKKSGLNRDAFDQIERARRIRGSAIDNFPLEELRAKAKGIEDFTSRAAKSVQESPVFESIRESNRSALKMLEQLSFKKDSSFEEMIKAVGASTNAWLKFKETRAGTFEALNSHLTQITKTSLLTESALKSMGLDRIGSAFRLPDDIRESLSRGFIDFSSSYKNLFKSFEIPETSLLSLPPSIARLPTVEYFNEVNLLETTIDKIEENESEYKEERESIKGEIAEATNNSIITQLQETNPDWVKMLEGAKQAFNSENPDKTRHCITSLRELVTQIMHYLSPDDQIRSWSKSEDDFHQNRPTRKARLKYIVRDINHGAFTEFVDKDIQATLAAINIFQAGTHSVNSKLTESQIRALIARVESAIWFLFSIANHED
jgi:hypothetical protein